MSDKICYEKKNAERHFNVVDIIKLTVLLKYLYYVQLTCVFSKTQNLQF